MPGRPELLDNLTEGTRHAEALTYLVRDFGPAHPLSVATGYVNLEGLHHLAESANDGRSVRLLLGAAPDPGLGADVPLARFQLALGALRAERDLARFPPSRAAQRLSAVEQWLREAPIEVHRYVEQFLHGKAYLFGTSDDGRAALVSSANLTGAGLYSNLELGLVNYQPGTAEHALRWFDGLWGAAAEFKDDLLALLFPDPGLMDPQTVYLRALLELYAEELERDVPPAAVSAVQLAPFQRDGYERARRILADLHGVVYADGVGTGKTEVGLAFIEEYALRLGHHALVVAPAQLKGNWSHRIHQTRLPAQVISFQELASDEQLAPGQPGSRRVLANARDSYRLIVIDEAHAFRNPDTTWYRAMGRLLGGSRKDVVMLTATPVNNGLWDLYHMIMLFLRHDRALAHKGISSARRVFIEAGANERDPEYLDPDLLFPVADAVSVRRDRRFIEQHYPGAVFPDGTPVRFPRPVARTERYDLDAAHPALFDDITGWIGGLTMARYLPTQYQVAGEGVRAAEAQLAGLLQSGILKRFESCWAACLATVERMVAAHRVFLAAWAEGYVPSREALRQASDDELDDAGIATWIEEAIEEDTDRRSIAEFRSQYRDHVQYDLTLLERIRDRLTPLADQSDPKLDLLARLLEECPYDKVAVFATYGDTVRYLDEKLQDRVGGRDRVVVIGGETDPDSRSRDLGRFCPETVVRPGYEPPDGEVDLLFSTDVLSEGQNLQQAGAVISYDMPWNPQRVVQRNGRVIRLKSPHEEVLLVTMLPAPGELDRLLGLEATIRRKILAAGVFGMESEVIDNVEVELRTYAARLEAGDPALVEDLEEEMAAFVGEELRALLSRAIEEGELERLRALPWGIGAGFRQAPGAPSKGAPGVFFACRTRDNQRYWRYVDVGGEVIDSEAEMLRRIDPGRAPGVPSPEMGIELEEAWHAAAVTIIEEHNLRADPRTAERSIGPVQRFALEVLRDPAVTLPPGAELAEEALSVERSSAIRKEVAAVRDQVANGTISRDEAARCIVDIVDSFGLRPVEPGPPLEPITEDEIGVVCWMGVLPSG